MAMTVWRSFLLQWGLLSRRATGRSLRVKLLVCAGGKNEWDAAGEQ